MQSSPLKKLSQLQSSLARSGLLLSSTSAIAVWIGLDLSNIFLQELDCFYHFVPSPQLVLSPQKALSSEFINARGLQCTNIPASLPDICSSVYMKILNNFRLALISIQSQGKFLIYDDTCNSILSNPLCSSGELPFNSPTVIYVLVVIYPF